MLPLKNEVWDYFIEESSLEELVDKKGFRLAINLGLCVISPVCWIGNDAIELTVLMVLLFSLFSLYVVKIGISIFYVGN